MNVAVFLPNWIGDVVMATPTLRALRKRIGRDGRLVGVMRPYVASVLAGTNWIDDTVFYDPRSDDRALHGAAVVERLRNERLDAAVLLTNTLRTAIVAWRSGARRRIGFDRYLRGPLLTDRLQHAWQGRTWYGARRYTPAPVLDDYLRLATAFGCEPESPRMELALTADDVAAADRAWHELRLPAGSNVVTFNTGGAFGAAKVWPGEYFAELARRVVADGRHSVLVICGPAEREAATEIVRRARHPRVVSLAMQPPGIGLSKACVARSRLLVSTDSGPRHFAAAFGVPVVTLFGPTHIAWSENHFDGAVHLQHQLPCGPCQRRVCPLGTHACLRELTAERVFRAVEPLLCDDQTRAA